MEYFVSYGNYINMESAKVITDLSKEEINQALYELAYQNAESYYGLHGFGLYEEEEEEFGEDGIHQCIEDSLEYWFEEWDEEEHAPACTYGLDKEPTIL